MVECFKTGADGTERLEQPEDGAWVSVVEPTADERAWLTDEIGVVPEFVQSAFDEEESAHIDYDDDTRQTLVIVDCPVVEPSDGEDDPILYQYKTQPLSVLLLPDQDLIVTVSLHENETVAAFAQGKQRGMNTNQRTRLLLQMVLYVMQRYLVYLRSIDRQYNRYEQILRQTMKNDELIKLLGIQKSLVYFSTSLKADEAMLVKVRSGRVIHLYDDDQDLLDDVFIELHQAIEMSSIYTNILSSTMEAFGTIISNNMNSVMGTLTVVTIVMAIPTIVYSLYGMNVAGLPHVESWLFPLGISAGLAVVAVLFFRRSHIFRF